MALDPLYAALPWAAPWAAFLRFARRSPRLGDAPDPPEPLQLISVIVPARNEISTIGTVIRSVLGTDYPAVELIVVDDRSDDGTAEAAAAAAGGDPRFRLIRGSDPPPGWFGKQWACLTGAEAARGAILAFTDADTRHAPPLLRKAAGALAARKVGLVTLLGAQRCVTFWERVVMPQMWLLLGLRFHPTVVNRARHARDVIANGQFLMFSRAAYERAGTHRAVRGDVAEDLALAHRCYSQGLGLHFAFAVDLFETRMYRGLGHLVEGWSKNLFLGGRRSFPEEPIRRFLAPVGLAAWMSFWLLPPLALIAAVAGLLPRALLLPAGVAWGTATLFWATVCAGMRIPAPYGLGYPAGAAVALFIIARSTWRGTRKVEWKGRVYSDRGDEEGPR